ncbi:GNAT family N-acetyltransferase [Streptomyces sp. NPDC048639]|uniref:GNAT family N-acetyltransferase n=1 Tax=Streptomyces sp. NPDC048639 TaxID=3365581 RepID=UPI00371AE64A
MAPRSEIRRVTRPDDVLAAGHLFDGPPQQRATERFLAEPGHHLFVAYVDGVPAGMVTGVETTHPDKGTEMFLYELAVDEPYRRRGIGRALTAALADLARERGCYGMWVATDGDNTAALATYASVGGAAEPDQTVLVWTFAAESVGLEPAGPGPAGPGPAGPESASPGSTQPNPTEPDATDPDPTASDPTDPGPGSPGSGRRR